MITCPRCKEVSGKLQALSRIDNKTRICNPCGTEESLQEFYRGFIDDKWLKEMKEQKSNEVQH